MSEIQETVQLKITQELKCQFKCKSSLMVIQEKVWNIIKYSF